MIVDSAWYHDGERRPVDLDAESVRRVRETGGFVWIGMHEPSATELDRVADLLDLHHLAVEDAVKGHQRPKVDPYDDMLFLVLKTLWYVDANDEVETGQVSIFLGRDYAVTVRQGAGVELGTVRHDLERNAHLLDHGPTAVAYSVCDRIVDGYEQVAAELENDVDEVEASVFSPGRSQDSQRIYVLKREIAEARRAVHPLKAPMREFADGLYDLLHDDSLEFWRDIADHVARATETIDTLDMLLSTAFDAHLARISVAQNEDMRRISAWVAIAAVGTLIAGIYGMNFDHMPELHWTYGYPLAIGLMVLASVVLYRLFKRSGWL
jgi:magnesium transporter